MATRGKFIVLTGATRGLGRALTEEFIRLGHTVAGCGRTRSVLDELASCFPPPHRFHLVDVTSDAQVARWASELLATHTAPDLLINNAALINRNAPLWQVPASEFDAVLDVNLKGVANVIRHFTPAMVARGSGVIVNFSSAWGRSTDAEVAPYCATKWGIEGLSQALAQDLPSALAAVALNPGIIDTDMLRSCFGNQAAAYPQPAEWARRAAPFLLRLGSRDNGGSLTVPD